MTSEMSSIMFHEKNFSILLSVSQIFCDFCGFRVTTNSG